MGLPVQPLPVAGDLAVGDALGGVIDHGGLGLKVKEDGVDRTHCLWMVRRMVDEGERG